jgi:nucleoside-diphosphate-sugar epimerase
MTILLTGATGFLGSHLLHRLLKLNYKVVILKRSTSNTWRIDSVLSKVKSYDIDKVDIENPFEEQRIDAVIHTVTNYGRNNSSAANTVDVNLMFSLKLLETATLFNTDIFFNTDTLLFKYLNYYSLSKKQFVEWLQYFSDKIKVVNLKLEHMYGPKDDNTKFVTWIINQMLQNIEYIDLTEGIQKRDFIYIDDVVDVYVLMLEKSRIFEAFSSFDVGTGEQMELKEFILKIYSEISGIKPINTKLNFGVKPYRDGEFMEIEESVQPLFDLGWKPQVSIENGIKKIIEYERGKNASY